MTQYGLSVTDFHEPRDGDLETRLNEMAMNGKRIISVMKMSHEWKSNGSNHGHGGSYKTHYKIVACAANGG